MPNLHTYLHPGVKGMQIRHFAQSFRQFAQSCIVFALSKFEANPFFRPVSKKSTSSVFFRRQIKEVFPFAMVL